MEQRLAKLKLELLVKQAGRCAICGGEIDLEQEAVEVDHIIPKADGGKDIRRNMALLHIECHRRKTNWERK